MVVTNVLNRALPLLRYAVEDRVIIDDEGTGSPWTGRRIRLGSRTFAPLVYGELGVDPGPLLERVLATPGALDAALTQTKRGLAVEVWFGDAGTDPAAVAALQRNLAAMLDDSGLAGAEVEVAATDDPATLPRTPAGKRKPVVALS